MSRLVVLSGFLLLAVPVAEASAQVIGTYRIRAGLGAQVRPEWLGSSNSEIAPYPTISIAKDDNPFGFGAPDDALSISLLKSGDFSAGPVAALRSGRDESEVGAPIGDVSRTVEIGAFAQYQISESFRLRSELRQGIGGHKGLVGHVGADFVTRDADRYVFSVGPRVRFSSGKFQRAFFGIGPEESLASGLPVYDPGGGIHAVGAVASARHSLGGNWGLFGYARYDRLVGDARNSPIVQDLGSRNQFSAGAGLSYIFTLKL